MNIQVVAVVGSLITFFFSSIATANAANVTSQNPQSLVAALQNAGYKATLSKDNDGDPRIETASSGNTIQIVFSDCDNHASCKTIEFVGLWSCGDTSVSKCKMNVETFNNDESPIKAIFIEKNNSIATYMYDFYDQEGTSERLFIRKLEIFSLGNQELSDLFSKK